MFCLELIVIYKSIPREFDIMAKKLNQNLRLKLKIVQEPFHYVPTVKTTDNLWIPRCDADGCLVPGTVGLLFVTREQKKRSSMFLFFKPSRKRISSRSFIYIFWYFLFFTMVFYLQPLFSISYRYKIQFYRAQKYCTK